MHYLYMHVCLYSCIFVCMFVFMYVYLYVCMYVYILCISVHSYVCIFICISVYICMYVCFTCMSVCICVCMYVWGRLFYLPTMTHSTSMRTYSLCFLIFGMVQFVKMWRLIHSVESRVGERKKEVRHAFSSLHCEFFRLCSTCQQLFTTEQQLWSSSPSLDSNRDKSLSPATPHRLKLSGHGPGVSLSSLQKGVDIKLSAPPPFSIKRGKTRHSSFPSCSHRLHL